MARYHMTNKKDREITEAGEIRELLKKGKYAAIAMCRNNEPYVVTMSYGYDELKNALYLHCANTGLKIDFITQNPIVCATVVEDGGYIVNECSHRYRSVVFWGNMSVVRGREEQIHGLEVMAGQLEDDVSTRAQKVRKYDGELQTFKVLRLDIGEITGKHGQ